MSAPQVSLRVLGRTRYAASLAAQRELRAQRIAGEAGDTLILTEHLPVFTLGRGAGTAHLHLTEREIEARGFDIARIERGGDVTYHGPGQLVVYPILDLATYGRDVRRYIWRLEETAIRLLAAYGVRGERRAGTPGVWSGRRKIASVGVHISRWVTLHGLAVNVDMDLAPFTLIDPCGLVGMEMTSIAAERGASVPLDGAMTRYPPIFAEVFGCALQRMEPSQTPQG